MRAFRVVMLSLRAYDGQHQIIYFIHQAFVLPPVSS